MTAHRLRRDSARLVAVATAALLVVGAASATAGPAYGPVLGPGGAVLAAAGSETDLTPFLNNVGIQRDPTVTNADFDGGGYAYSGVALLVGDPAEGYAGVEPGDAVSAGGFTFTWPDRPPGATDNVMAVGQTIPVPEVAGATKVGFLGAGAGGTQTGQVTLHYTIVDEDGQEQEVTRTAQLTFTDWTRGLLGDDPLQPNEQVVIKTRFRSTTGGPFFFTMPHVFLVTIPLDATMTLQSVRLPTNPAIHLFGLALAPEVTIQEG